MDEGRALEGEYEYQRLYNELRTASSRLLALLAQQEFSDAALHDLRRALAGTRTNLRAAAACLQEAHRDLRLQEVMLRLSADED